MSKVPSSEHGNGAVQKPVEPSQARTERKLLLAAAVGTKTGMDLQQLG